MRAQMPTPGAAHRKTAQGDAISIDRVMPFDMRERLEYVHFAGKLEGIAVTAIGMQDEGVRRHKLTGRRLPAVDEVQLAERLAAAVTPDIEAESMREHAAALTQLGTVYKEINAPFGPLSFDVLSASTRALSSGSSADDSTYSAISGRITSLTNDRDALAAQMRDVLNNAAFGGPIPTTGQIYDLASQGNTLLTRANQLGVGYSP